MSNKDSVFHMQAEFLTAGDVQFPATENKEDVALLHEKLIGEEFDEVSEEAPFLLGGDMNHLKELCDLIYVASQALNQSVGPDAALAMYQAVHANNMDKCVDGKLIKNEHGKILKPEGFDKNAWRADFAKLLESK